MSVYVALESGVDANTDLLIDNITTTGSTRALYVVAGSNTYSKEIIFINSDIDNLYIRDLNSFTFYGNQINTASNFNFGGIANLYSTKDTGSGTIGNLWSDFVCADSNDNSSVSYNSNNYIICNPTDYNVNGIVDDSPLLAIWAGAPVGPGSEGSSSRSSSSGLFPSGNMFISLVMLFLFFVSN